MKSLLAESLPESQSKKIFSKIMEKISDNDYSRPHEFIKIAMQHYDHSHDRSVHGKIFEFAIGEILAQNGIGPLYYQAQLQHVPLANFDWLLYHPVNVVSISCKTKARERWKQAAMEALALKRVYPQSINYLVTIEELSKPEDKIKDAPQTLDYIIVANESAFSDVVDKLSQMKFEIAREVSPIVNGLQITVPAS